ncbi:MULTISPECIES: S-methyl-5'-thioadenosine phosphorylase [unclassified Novosphingobium]|uniref:S-methyl-5'-thioadenosine phosphorylase n=1 Tax=unclassified Novosphingobium TaxID=2644732 RepID=UPI00180606EF|nr:MULTISPECIES: S-methyl-5'-thioadenosine phosphorylase [unclassified Novosphingobium]NMN03229.1 5'-methylthioadenosine phosphorylase [Novosphingobium sp. SG919]NMN86781.1 5'-methylthioadenosine phosphorylase [Novosphingobium sp. SG916]
MQTEQNTQQGNPGGHNGARWRIGVIGGSGIYDLSVLDEVQEIAVQSPFGQPSGPVTLGRIGGQEFVFLARHGAGHRISPESINHRANIDVMKRCGVTDLVAISAIGSLREELAPGSFVAVDQFIDRTHGRADSFFGEGLVAHVSLADPVCARLAGLVADAAQAAGAAVHRGGCYLAMQGPQFSTRAESRLYRQWGADVIGMTAMPEARLAREAELPYALIGMVTDYDAWRDGEHVDVAEVLRVMRGNAATARATVAALAGLLPQVRTPSPVDRALEGAIMTAPAQRDPVLVARLGAVAGRVLKP